MSATFDDLRILKTAEEIADSIWKTVVQWDKFAKDVVGIQMARSADSVGANLAESYGRFNFGEKLQLLYYSRGSIFETKYWLNRTSVRDLMESDVVEEYVNQLTELARKLNSFASGLKNVRSEQKKKPGTVHQDQTEYLTTTASEEILLPLFTNEDLHRLKS